MPLLEDNGALTDAELEKEDSTFRQTLMDVLQGNKEVLKQLKLLNARAEEAWGTKIKESDIT